MTLWTPDGERPINREPTEPDPASGPADSLTPEEQEQAAAMAQELTEARARLLETEVSTVLVNHALGIYELGAIHLTAEQPDFDEAKLAIDALAALVEGLTGQLGDGEPTLKDGLHQLRMAYVQRSQEAKQT
ncbi:MAG: DUF1844 domain-containing protein [Acidimicrobiia bacterium]|nr:DUF1844 domain-containing protein [Acidimicrobiia bacterium]